MMASDILHLYDNRVSKRAFPDQFYICDKRLTKHILLILLTAIILFFSTVFFIVEWLTPGPYMSSSGYELNTRGFLISFVLFFLLIYGYKRDTSAESKSKPHCALGSLGVLVQRFYGGYYLIPWSMIGGMEPVRVLRRGVAFYHVRVIWTQEPERSWKYVLNSSYNKLPASSMEQAKEIIATSRKYHSHA